MADTERIKRLKWLCRRGMKELDVLLGRFLQQHEQLLTAGAWPELEILLQTGDDRLWNWLQNPERTDNVQFYQLVSDIRYGTTATN